LFGDIQLFPPVLN